MCPQELPECAGGKEQLCDVDPSYLLLEDVGRGFHGNYSCEGLNDAGWGPLSESSELVVYCKLSVQSTGGFENLFPLKMV